MVSANILLHTHNAQYSVYNVLSIIDNNDDNDLSFIR